MIGLSDHRGLLQWKRFYDSAVVGVQSASIQAFIREALLTKK